MIQSVTSTGNIHKNRGGELPRFYRQDGELHDSGIGTELELIQVIIHSLFCHQFIMGALLDNFTVTDHGNFIRILDGGKAMGHHQCCTAFAEFIQGLLDQDLCGIVQRAGCFIQNQNRRILQENPGNGKALFLPAGETNPPFADIRIISVRK